MITEFTVLEKFQFSEESEICQPPRKAIVYGRQVLYLHFH